MTRDQYFRLLREFRSKCLKDTGSIAVDKFIEYCENTGGFRPIANGTGYTGEFRVINEAKFNWLLLQRKA